MRSFDLPPSVVQTDYFIILLFNWKIILPASTSCVGFPDDNLSHCTGSIHEPAFNQSLSHILSIFSDSLFAPKLKEMTKFISLIVLLLFNGSLLFGQKGKANRPKLVVGIIVDQMRFDQLYKYEDRYGKGGFKRIMQEGFNFKNAHFNYVPTVTAAGHASIYTGTTPSVHGIVGNNWFNRYTNTSVGNVKDSTVTIVGSAEENKNGVSPGNLLSTTISDQLRLGSNFRSKVISVSFKDRGAILPGGHTANAAYWHDWQTSPGYFVSSSHYMEKLPEWASKFNHSGKASEYLDWVWNPLYPIETYTASEADSNGYERTLRGKSGPVFPYDFPKLRETYRELKAEYQMLWVSPRGNTLLTDFAMEAIKGEQLGTDNFPDLLNISYSVPDAAGHTFGPQSIELEDIYLRLDQDIENLLNFLDKSVGKDGYVLFLTADHGAIPVASYLHDHKLPTGIAGTIAYTDSLAKYLNTRYGENDWIQKFDGENIYLNRPLIAQADIELKEIQQYAADWLVNQKGISIALTAFQLETTEYRLGTRAMMQNGYHPKRSGDIVLAFDPGFIQNSGPDIDITEVKGTTHGSGYAYDTHVPILWKGRGIPKGESVRKVSITDIAPSLAMLLNLNLPSGTSGLPLGELFE